MGYPRAWTDVPELPKAPHRREVARLRLLGNAWHLPCVHLLLVALFSHLGMEADAGILDRCFVCSVQPGAPEPAHLFFGFLVTILSEHISCSSQGAFTILPRNICIYLNLLIPAPSCGGPRTKVHMFQGFIYLCCRSMLPRGLMLQPQEGSPVSTPVVSASLRSVFFSPVSFSIVRMPSEGYKLVMRASNPVLTWL